MNVGARLRQRMKQKDMTAYRLAQRAGLSWNAVDHILNRESNPTVRTLEKLCKALELSLAELFQDDTHDARPSEEQIAYLCRRDALNDRDRRILDSTIEAMLNE